MAKKETKSEQKLNVEQIINYLKNDLGVTFNYKTEDYARHFLSEHNYYFRLKHYACDFEKKSKTGKYVGLDFGHLVELSTIDMHFRKLILKLTIDLEHYLKVKLVNDCQENSRDDGYKVVEDFFEKHPKIKESVTATIYLASYSASEIKHLEKLAVWNIIELLSFYDFTIFFEYYYKYFEIPCENIKHFESVRRLRNVAAHNACMLASFKPLHNFKYDAETCFKLLQKIKTLSPNIVSSAMKVPLLNDFAVMLDVYNTTLTSEQIKRITMKELKNFFEDRMIRNKDWFENCTEIKNAYRFAYELVKRYAQ